MNPPARFTTPDGDSGRKIRDFLPAPEKCYNFFVFGNLALRFTGINPWVWNVHFRGVLCNSEVPRGYPPPRVQIGSAYWDLWPVRCWIESTIESVESVIESIKSTIESITTIESVATMWNNWLDRLWSGNWRYECIFEQCTIICCFEYGCKLGSKKSTKEWICLSICRWI